jgi:hypothetical protein
VPSRPRYTCTSDVNQLLKLFVSWGSNVDLSVKHLSLKLVALLALTSAQRVQTLASIRLTDIKGTSERFFYQFKIKNFPNVKGTTFFQVKPVQTE